MRVVCVWREESDYGRAVREWLRDFERQTGVEIESLDPDSAEGESFARAHDVVEYPTILAVDDRGAILQEWRGAVLPLIDQVAYYVI